MSATGSETRSGIGVRLRAGRERMGLTLLQAAERLHVDPKVVECLETENFGVLGAPVFIRGHLKRYSELIGEQTAQLLELHTGATKPALPDLTQLPKAAPESSPSRLALPALLVLIAFVLIGVVWWVMQALGPSDESNEAPAARERASEVREVPAELETSTVPVDVPMPGARTNSGGSSALTPTGTRESAQQPGVARSGGDSAQNAAATPASPPGKAMEVTLRFAADSWVEVYDANGEKLFYDIGSADTQRTFSGTPPFRVTLGNAPGVTLNVNGKPAAVPANVVRDDSAQFVINRSGRIVRARE
jgi:cytoskeleton protein RodZ